MTGVLVFCIGLSLIVTTVAVVQAHRVARSRHEWNERTRRWLSQEERR